MNSAAEPATPPAQLATVDAARLAGLPAERRPVFLARVETPGADGVLVERFAVRFPPGVALPEGIDAAARFEVRDRGALLETGMAGVALALMAVVGAVIMVEDLHPGLLALVLAAAALIVTAARTPRSTGFVQSDSGDVVFLDHLPVEMAPPPPPRWIERPWSVLGKIPLALPIGLGVAAVWQLGAVGGTVGLLGVGAAAWGGIRLLAGGDDEDGAETAGRRGFRKWLRELDRVLGYAIPAAVAGTLFHLLGQGLPAWVVGVVVVLFCLDRWHQHVRDEPDDAALEREAERLMGKPALRPLHRILCAAASLPMLYVAVSEAGPLLDTPVFIGLMLLFLVGTALLLLAVTGGPRQADRSSGEIDPEEDGDGMDASPPAQPAALAPPPLDLGDVLSREREIDRAYVARDR